MILGCLAEPAALSGMTPRLTAGLRWLQETDLAALPPGRHDIAGAGLYALVSESQTLPAARGRWEAHRRFIDIHCVAVGSERIGWADAQALRAGPYDEQKDVCFLEGRGDFFTLRPGLFAVMFPRDAHMPGLALHRPRPLRKVVVKAAVSG